MPKPLIGGIVVFIWTIQMWWIYLGVKMVSYEELQKTYLGYFAGIFGQGLITLVGILIALRLEARQRKKIENAKKDEFLQKLNQEFGYIGHYILTEFILKPGRHSDFRALNNGYLQQLIENFGTLVSRPAYSHIKDLILNLESWDRDFVAAIDGRTQLTGMETYHIASLKIMIVALTILDRETNDELTKNLMRMTREAFIEHEQKLQTRIDGLVSMGILPDRVKVRRRLEIEGME